MLSCSSAFVLGEQYVKLTEKESIELAAAYVSDAFFGRNKKKKNISSFGKIMEHLWIIKYLMQVFYALLSWVERPSWCYVSDCFENDTVAISSSSFVCMCMCVICHSTCSTIAVERYYLSYMYMYIYVYVYQCNQ